MKLPSAVMEKKLNGLTERLARALEERFGEPLAIPSGTSGLDELHRQAAHRVHRRYTDRPVEPELLRLLCACALSAPSKSDLQQGDILVVRDSATIEAIAKLIPDMPWIATAPVFLIFLANGRRIPQIAGWRGKPFPNDHLDLFFNAAVDAAIVLSQFIRAAEAAGLGCCPISVIRDHAQTIVEMCSPSAEGRACCRHVPRLAGGRERHQRAPAACGAPARGAFQRRRACGGRSTLMTAGAPPCGLIARSAIPSISAMREFYGWSEDKARQYAVPQRADFGAFVRRQGFNLK